MCSGHTRAVGGTLTAAGPYTAPQMRARHTLWLLRRVRPLGRTAAYLSRLSPRQRGPLGLPLFLLLGFDGAQVAGGSRCSSLAPPVSLLRRFLRINPSYHTPHTPRSSGGLSHPCAAGPFSGFAPGPLGAHSVLKIA